MTFLIACWFYPIQWPVVVAPTVVVVVDVFAIIVADLIDQ